MRLTLQDLRAQQLKDEEKHKSTFKSEMRKAVSNDRHPERDEMITVNNAMFMEGLDVDDEGDQNKGDAPMEEETSESAESDTGVGVPAEPAQHIRREIELEEDS
ncbi:unnamed protein product [Nippostrongylus brasiliensis]|uniref:CDC37_C domain-containing protein n=1 Tax=Nippostrongylus brasiliensis TaxID=27835 RepID=A0A0N4XHE5_NIPBR|nr:unnamed protein product [Nippostrongylus brasiliensis]